MVAFFPRNRNGDGLTRVVVHRLIVVLALHLRWLVENCLVVEPTPSQKYESKWVHLPILIGVKIKDI